MQLLRWYAAASLLAFGSVAGAEPTRVVVTIENLAPERGTSQTPFWVGLHGGEFDTYNGNTPASSLPVPGSNAMESLCEDGDNAAIAADFAAITEGVDATLPGPSGPLAPGDVATGSFVVDSEDPATRYFSYASMILPSNDFCVSNGNPFAHPIFDDAGNFVGESFFVTGEEALDSGTEVNDELPVNTAFFGQTTPNTGVDENGLIGTIGVDRLDLTGFLPPGSGGILDDPRFAMGDFSERGYSFVKISFAAAPAFVEDLDFKTLLDADNEVPAVDSKARGLSWVSLRDEGGVLRHRQFYKGLSSPVVAAHLHLGGPDENGPVVALLLPEDLSELSRIARFRLRKGFRGSLAASDLTGPLTGQPLDALIGAIEAGNVYVNIHTEQNPGGEIRGQLKLY